MQATRSIFVLAAALVALVTFAPQARAQNPVQWTSNPKAAAERAAEQALPLLVWVKDGRDSDESDIEDAQEDCFRDPTVVSLIQSRFVPLRAMRNSRSVEVMAQLGLPTGFGLYCAVVTCDGRLIDQMGPAEVAQPHIFAQRLRAAYEKYCADVYEKDLRPVLEDPAAPKSKVRTAARAVWRLGITQADTAIVGLLKREDVTESERARIYDLLAALGTRTSIEELLRRAAEPAAAAALTRAQPGALEWLLPALPAADAEPTPGQLAAYTAAAKICRTAPREKAWWSAVKPELRQQELDRVRGQATAALEFWRAQQNAVR